MAYKSYDIWEDRGAKSLMNLITTTAIEPYYRQILPVLIIAVWLLYIDRLDDVIIFFIYNLIL